RRVSERVPRLSGDRRAHLRERLSGTRRQRVHAGCVRRRPLERSAARQQPLRCLPRSLPRAHRHPAHAAGAARAHDGCGPRPAMGACRLTRVQDGGHAPVALPSRRTARPPGAAAARTRTLDRVAARPARRLDALPHVPAHGPRDVHRTLAAPAEARMSNSPSLPWPAAILRTLRQDSSVPHSSVPSLLPSSTPQSSIPPLLHSSTPRQEDLLLQFSPACASVGGEVHHLEGVEAVADFIASLARGGADMGSILSWAPAHLPLAGVLEACTARGVSTLESDVRTDPDGQREDLARLDGA